ncbi:SixA phosphatase family protein [Marilutibacter alkalisoli]|nr:phosphoglycerate mutase family protein [Lysobacter alkalisoli]
MNIQRTIPCIAALLLLPMLAGCASRPAPSAMASDDIRFVVVRHAEKQSGTGASENDPGLTESGRCRAGRLAQSLDDARLVAVYSTPYRRTRDTGLQTAQAHGLDMIEYDPHQPATDFADTLRATHRSGTVLIVGHSNTVPALVSALCECAVSEMGEDEYDHRFIIAIDAAGNARMSDMPLP